MNFENFSDAVKFLSGKEVFVGLSGGSDSVFLTLMLNHYKDKFKFRLVAVNFEHGIRGKESEEDTEFCLSLCEDLNIPIIVKKLNISKNTKNLECVARQKRLEWYKENLPKNSILVLGHHADDVIENVLIRMVRGSNLSGLLGLREITIYNGCEYTVYRPLLKYRKAEIQEFLNSNGIKWRTDSTNLDSDCLRNFIRNELLSKLYKKYDGSFKGMFLCIENIIEDAEFIESYVDARIGKLGDKKYIDANDFLSQDRCIRNRMLKNFADELNCGNLTKGFYNEFEKMITSNNQHPMKLKSGNFEVNIIKKRIYFSKVDGR